MQPCVAAMRTFEALNIVVGLTIACFVKSMLRQTRLGPHRSDLFKEFHTSVCS